MNKLKSRKFWLTVLGAAFVIVNETFDLGISPESQNVIIGIIVSFIVGESAVDAVGAVRTKKAVKEEEDGSNYSH